MGNHNLELISAMKSLQYGEQALALPVESTGDVGDDVGVGVEFSHMGDLALEVSALLRSTDAAITDCFCVRLSSEEGVDVIEALSACVAIVGDFALAGIAPQSLGMESEPCYGFAAWQIGHTFILT